MIKQVERTTNIFVIRPNLIMVIFSQFSLIFDAMMITLHSRTKKEDDMKTKSSFKRILMIVDITIAIIFMITYFANVIATFVSMPLIVS